LAPHKNLGGLEKFLRQPKNRRRQRWAPAKLLAAAADDVSRGKQLPLPPPIDSCRRRRSTAIAAAAALVSPAAGGAGLPSRHSRSALSAITALVSPATGGAGLPSLSLMSRTVDSPCCHCLLILGLVNSPCCYLSLMNSLRCFLERRTALAVFSYFVNSPYCCCRCSGCYQLRSTPKL
jgi:hypothetical protein